MFIVTAATKPVVRRRWLKWWSAIAKIRYSFPSSSKTLFPSLRCHYLVGRIWSYCDPTLLDSFDGWRYWSAREFRTKSVETTLHYRETIAGSYLVLLTISGESLYLLLALLASFGYGGSSRDNSIHSLLYLPLVAFMRLMPVKRRFFSSRSISVT